MAESGIDLPRDFAAESDGFAVVFPAFFGAGFAPGLAVVVSE
jgi:hypothetical protein